MPTESLITLERVLLPESPIPVLDAEGFSPRYQSTSLPVWSNATGPYPSITALHTCRENITHLYLQGTFSPSLRGRQIKVDGILHDFPRAPSSGILAQSETPYTLPIDSDTFTLPVRFHGDCVNDTTPWGLRYDVAWSVCDAETQEMLVDIKTPIEIYAVSVYTHAFFIRDGIPLDLLRYFVLTTRREDAVGIIDDYPAHVVRAVHSSGFKYNVLNGAMRYNQSDGSFALTKWLRDQKRANKSTMNCIDIAKLTGLVLGLGFSSEKEVENLQWCQMVPFGFIRPTHLIGWDGPDADKTTSPFVKDDGSLDLTDMNPATRSMFSRHWFLRWNDMILDATCGPKVGTQRLREWFDAGVDVPPEGREHFKLNGELCPSRGDPDTNDFKPERFYAESYGAKAEVHAPTGVDSTWTKINEMLRPMDFGGDISFAVKSLVQELGDRCGPGYDFVSEEPYWVEAGEAKGTKMTWVLRCSHGGKETLLDLQITSFGKTEDAKTTYDNTGMNMSKTHSEAAGRNIGKGIWHVTGSTEGTQAFGYTGTVFCMVLANGLDENKTIPVLDALQGFLEDEKTHKVADLGTISVSEVLNSDGTKPASEVRCREIVNVKFEVEHYLRYDWSYENSCMMVLDARTSGETPGKTTISFRLLARNTGSAVLNFTFLGPNAGSVQGKYSVEVIE